MAELLLGALLPVLYEHLSSHALIKFANREKVSDLVMKWETKLRYISALLEDAEEKAMNGDVKVQPWLEDLRDLVYDIDNIVDEFVTDEGIRSLPKQAADGANTSKVRSLVTSLKPGFMSDKKLRSRMKKIDHRLDFILEQKINLGLTETSGSTRNTSHSNSHRMTDSLPQHNVIGRQKDESTILAELLTEKTDDQHLTVIPIVGLGGVGKTTLAQSVFNNPAVIEAFPKRGWACVSDNFNMVDIARSLLRSLGGSVDTSDDLNSLHNKLRGILSKEKFLIVLDDYWNVDYNNWERLYNMYSLGVVGSKVLVTTRNLDVASMMTNSHTVSLRELSRDDCLSLLAYHALGVENFDAHSHLKLIGEEIAAKCKGLPLAAKTLGGLLRSKSDTREWEEIRDSMIWNFPQGKDDILLALKLSYIHLPPHLKRCFVFCAIFPEDYEFDRDELVLLWMADGLVEMKRKNTKSCMLDQGRRQFDELQSMSFFQRSTQNESLFVMHDLMRDLATSIGGNTCLNVDSSEIEDVKYKSPEKIRHLLYSSMWELDVNFAKFHVLKGSRTFIASHKRFLGNLSDNVLEEFLQNLKYLRVLSLRHYHFIEKIPNCIGHLKHLRYLKFSENSTLKELPESICTLYNLETLILNGCSGLTELPRGMDKLINLKCLDIGDTPVLKKMPVELGRLHNLEILTKFIVGREEDGLRLNVLRNLQHLQGEIIIFDLQNVGDVGDARDAGLNSKIGLTTVTLVWYDMSNDFGSCFYRNIDKERMVFEFLQPHRKIEEACIYGYGGISFPLWIGSPSLTNMTKVQLGFCGKVTILPSFGLLPCLRELEMERMDAVRTVGSEFYGNAERPFPCLEVLKFEGMTAWEVWSSTSCGDREIEEPFPRLTKLELRNCPSLVSNLPHRLCSLVELSIYKCPLLKASPCMADLSSLKDLKLEGCKFDLLAIVSSASRNSFKRIISLNSIQKLMYLNKDILRAAECLEIGSCDELIGLWKDDVSKSVVASFTSLRYLSITFCANLQKLPNNMQRLTSLRELTIQGCSKLQSLPKKIMSCNLEKLDIYRCQSLEVAKVPSTLISLKIYSCEKMKGLSNGTSVINNGDSSLRNNAMHLQLEDLDIHDSSIRNIPHFLSMSTKLAKLEVSNCPFLKMDVFSELPSCLRSLTLHRCKKIKALPHQMNTTLTSLQCLSLWGLNIESFPEGGLPLSIEELTLGVCPRFKQPLEELGLHRLPALKSLTIAGEIGGLWLQQDGIMTSFPRLPSDWLLFPSNLETLQIEYQHDMVRLSNGLRDHLTSLRWLQFFSCPNLQFLPKEGFPPSLEHLDIEGCSQDLVSNCSKNGEYFPLIRSIQDFIV